MRGGGVGPFSRRRESSLTDGEVGSEFEGEWAEAIDEFQSQPRPGISSLDLTEDSVLLAVVD